MAPTARSLGNARLSMLAQPRTLTTREDFAADIRREWTNALEATVAVGRRLNEAKEALPHGDYQAMVENDLPFSTATARKLREIAAFVDRDEVPLDRLPEAMSTLYAIATLPDETRQQALDQGVIRPEVTRAEVEALKVPAAAPVDQVPSEIVERREALRTTLESLFAGSLDADDDPVTAMVKPASAPLPLLERQPAEPPVIEGEAVQVAEGPSAVELPPPPITVKPPRPSRFDVALSRSWHTDPTDPGAIMVDLDGMRRVLLVMVAPDPAAADIVRHVVDLHNASLEG